MENFIVAAILVLIIAAAVYGTVRRIRYGSSCCGGKEAVTKKIRVKDRNKANYPFRYLLKVNGMHCENCAKRVENAFNAVDGRWATVDLEKKEVLLLSKHEETEDELRQITASAGYTMVSLEAE
ncbi:MAG: cation transporter [Firmicutes bacterium]|nr:cation transporter [Bacillota bacterium]